MSYHVYMFLAIKVKHSLELYVKLLHIISFNAHDDTCEPTTTVLRIEHSEVLFTYMYMYAYMYLFVLSAVVWVSFLLFLAYICL